MTTGLAPDHIVFGSTRIDYLVSSSPRRSTVAIRVGPEEGVEVVVPEGFDPERVPALVRKKAPWIIEKLLLVQEQVSAPEREYVSGESFLYAGRRYRLKVVRDARCEIPSLSFEHGSWRARVPAGTPEEELRRVLRPVFIGWYRERAEARLQERVRRYSRQMGLEPRAVVVTEQARRWGSCTKTGVLRINWRIVMAPASILDYVVVHELAHLVEKDHGRRFWRLVETVIPDHDDRREWLRKNGGTLTV